MADKELEPNKNFNAISKMEKFIGYLKFCYSLQGISKLGKKDLTFEYEL